MIFHAAAVLSVAEKRRLPAEDGGAAGDREAPMGAGHGKVKGDRSMAKFADDIKLESPNTKVSAQVSPQRQRALVFSLTPRQSHAVIARYPIVKTAVMTGEFIPQTSPQWKRHDS